MFIRTVAAALIAASLSLPALPSQAQEMLASYYGKAFQGRPMANGEPFNMYALSVAHKTLPLGTLVCIINIRNRRRINYVPVTDRGPYIRGRDIDVSYEVARRLGFVEAGTARLQVVPC